MPDPARSELAPCPFCGSGAVIVDGKPRVSWSWVWCRNCDARGSLGTGSHAREHAVERWNGVGNARREALEEAAEVVDIGRDMARRLRDEKLKAGQFAIRGEQLVADALTAAGDAIRAIRSLDEARRD